uniref:Uncharacterized protein n=1 Tax=Alexandrium monilatum TaxID=311494 RepID=A0A7S4R5P0_9DINO
MGKKPAAGKAKAKASSKKAEPEPEEEQPTPEQLEAKRLWQQRREASKWAQAQLAAVREQVAAAKKAKLDWLEAAHEFHEIRLIKLAKRLEEKTLDAVPQELRDGVEAYLSQCAGGPATEKEGFDERRGAWDALDQDSAAYVRKPESPEAAAAAEALKAEQAAEAVTKAMVAHAASPAFQEAGLIRLGGLFGQAREGAELPGLTCEATMPAIGAAMRGHLADPGVQRAGCAALRGLAMAPGQLPLLRDAGGIEVVVTALNAHYKDKEVALAANGAFWAMAQSAGKNSPEIATMRAAGVEEALLKVMTHHAWDQTLCGKVRVTLPFIQED